MTARTWMRACCSSPGLASCRRTTAGSSARSTPFSATSRRMVSCCATGQRVAMMACRVARVCSFWLVNALQGAGRRDEAVALFERLLSLRNDVGLLSEQWDPGTNRQLGNTPQAFSHFALINSALLLHHGGAEHGNRAPRPMSGSGL